MSAVPAPGGSRPRRPDWLLVAPTGAEPGERRASWVLFLALLVVVGALFVPDRGGSSRVRTAGGATGSSSGAAPGGGDAGADGTPIDASGGARSFVIAATGDLLVHESVALSAATGDGTWDFRPLFGPVAPVLREADLAVCHVESPLSPDDTDLSYYPVFNVPNELADAIADAGYDTCSLASNHSLDTGETGVRGTLEALDRVGVAHHGMARSADERADPNLIEVAGVTVAHLSYAYGFNTGPLPADAPWLANLIEVSTIAADAAAARHAGAEFVVVSLHWGTQYQTELDELQRSIGPRVVALDEVDLVLGHHAHVVQPVTELDGEFIVNGLGNFLSNQSPESCPGCPPATQDGVVVRLRVSERPGGGFAVTGLDHVPTWVDRTDHRIELVRSPDRPLDPTVLDASAARTAAALSAAGVEVPVGDPGRPVADLRVP